MRIFANRAFAADNAVLFLLMIAFVPLFFFASTYSQISLGDDPSQAGLYLLTFFAGFAAASQLGGRILDSTRRPARGDRRLCGRRRRLLPLGQQLPDLDYSTQWYWIVLAGAGCGLILGPAEHRRDQPGAAGDLRRGHRDHPDRAQLRLGDRSRGARHPADLPEPVQHRVLAGRARDRPGQGGRRRRLPEPVGRQRARGVIEGPDPVTEKVFEAVQLDYALATRSVFYVMAAVMAVAFVVAAVALPGGKVEGVEEDPAGGAGPATSA